MFEIKKRYDFDIEVKRSKFLATLVPVGLLDVTLAKLKEEHPKARHFIVAWRKLNEFNQTVEYSTDDGEPKGTSGKPTLNVLRGSELINTAVIIVRYFGGIKLGTGGLVRAYGDAAKAVIEAAELHPFESKYPLCVAVQYTHHNKLEHFLESLDVLIEDKQYDVSTVTLKLKVTREQEEKIQTYQIQQQIFHIEK